MAAVEPFGGIRYTSADISHLIAPPYDVLDAAAKQALLRKDEHNIVAIDLPHMPPKEAGPDEVYSRAAGEMTSWLDIRCLARDESPAIYVYHQSYKLGGKALTRKMFFCRLRLEEFGKGGVFAHEQTFGGPKEDRLKLTTATRCNLSPIFGLYPDAENEISALLESYLGGPPDQTAVLESVQNKLWVLTEELALDELRSRMANRPIFIADGHHRYSTALMYRQHFVDEIGALPAEDPINFVLAVLCGMEDPGATIQPYFRTICELRGITPERLREAIEADFTWTVGSKPATADELASRLAAAGPQSIGLYFGKEHTFTVISPRNADLLARYEPKRGAAWRSLPYAILHRYLIDEVIRPRYTPGAEPIIHYHKTMEEAVQDATQAGGIAALMPASTMAQLRAICTAGELMPQKSTYFFPKLATGMVINPLY